MTPPAAVISIPAGLSEPDYCSWVEFLSSIGGKVVYPVVGGRALRFEFNEYEECKLFWAMLKLGRTQSQRDAGP